MIVVTWPVLILALLPNAEPAVTAHVVLRNATLYDGTGRPGYLGDLAIKGERIVGIGHCHVSNSPRIVDATGLIVVPGFIDLHTHSDVSLPVVATRANLSALMQGVTTVVTGNCGSGPVDLPAYFKLLEPTRDGRAGGVGSNVIHLVPHNSIRSQVLGNADRRATPAELLRMEALVEHGMADGAWGFSTGLSYTPGVFADTAELIALARVASRHGGFYATHLRDEGTGLLSALDEALTIGRDASIPVHVSHLKVAGRVPPNTAAAAIERIERARREGSAVTADQYPYTASSTTLAATVVPARFRAGTARDYRLRLDGDPMLRAGIVELLHTVDPTRIRLANYQPRPDWQGHDLDTLAREENTSVLELVLDIERHGGAQIIHFSMNEEDVRLFARQPWVAIASDSASIVPDRSVPHPRFYGTFARAIGTNALAEKVLPLEQAIYRATGLPAAILRLDDRGVLKVGAYADVVVLEPNSYRDRATYDRPHQYATGVRSLLVNGQLVVDRGVPTGLLPGKLLRHWSP